MLKKHLRIAVIMLAVFTILTGGAYPALVTGIAHLLFPEQAEGSILTRSGRAIGSALIGQPFSSQEYFWSRPSATEPFQYNAAASSGSNLALSNTVLRERIRHDVAQITAADSTTHAPVPVDLVTSSASGLDPHISPAAALFQVRRVARSRGVDEARVRSLVDAHTEGRFLGIFGEPRVNILKLNLALDAMGSVGGNK
jgi:potassium-transporting ATPase KdpC subunit